MIKAIIFDFDGVIFDSEPIHWEACNSAFKQVGFTVPYEKYLKNYVGIAAVEMFPKVLADYGYHYSNHEIKQLIHQKHAIYKNIINSTSDLVGVTGLSKFLAATHKIISKFAICSGSTRAELETMLAKLEKGALEKYFEFMTTSEDVTNNKPSPEGYLKTAEKLNVDPAHCLVIEDTKNGILAAKEANMRVIGITTTNAKEALCEADLIINHYGDINLADLPHRLNC